jgi:hypothetical protein
MDMTVQPSPAEKNALAAVWRDQKKVKGPPVDLANPDWPKAWGETTDPGVDQVAGALQKALAWPSWVRLYTKPAYAVLAASRLAKRRGLSGGVLWMAPGSGAPFGSPQSEPGVAMLRADWTPHAKAMTLAEEDIRRQGLLMVLDESATGFRLAAGGAREAFALKPDLVLFGQQLAGGLDFAALAGQDEPPTDNAKEPGPQALAMAAGIIPRAAQIATQERLAALGRALVMGLDYYCAKAGLDDEVRWEGPLAMPRLAGRRLWAFMELTKEEGLHLAPMVMPDPTVQLDAAAELIWPRLARAAARLKVLPEGEKAPLGWKDAAQVSSCRQVSQILESFK